MPTSNLPPHTQQSDPVFELGQLAESLELIFQKTEDQEELYQALVRLVVSLTGAGAVSLDIAKSKEEPQLLPVASLVTEVGDKWPANLLEILRSGGSRAVETGQVAIARLAGNEAVVMVALPVRKESSTLILSGAIPPGKISPELCVVIFHLLGQCLVLRDGGLAHSETVAADHQQKDYSGLQAIAANLLACESKETGIAQLLQELQNYFEADAVMLACDFERISGPQFYHSAITGFSQKSQEIQSVKQVMEECRQQESILAYNLELASGRYLKSYLIKELSAAFFCSQAVCFPLQSSSGEVDATLLILYGSNKKKSQRKVESFSATKVLFDGLVCWLSKYGQKARKQRQPERKRAKIVKLGVLMVLAVSACFLPVTFSVEGDCVLEPQKRRYVAARFDGIIKEVHKLPGDQVAEGELLAELDGRAIELEINAIQAEIEKSRKRADVHVATGKAALAQMARLERRALEDRLKIQQERAMRLIIVSPAAGVVISENLKRIEGSPVSRGEGLFEIAPLDHMIAEARISQQDISYVNEGQVTRLELDSFPGRSWKSTVDGIFPRATLRDGRYVFLVESSFTSDQKDLQPGMRGTLAINAGKKPLIWKLFRRPWLYVQKTFLLN